MSVIVFPPNRCQRKGCKNVFAHERTILSEGMSFEMIRLCEEHNAEYDEKFWGRIAPPINNYHPKGGE